MDKRDFYRELMDGYAFDKEKIYNNAKLGRLSGKSKLRSMQMPVYIGMTAAAAAVVVTVGSIVAVNLGGRGVQPIQAGESVGALSSELRTESDNNAVSENENSNGSVDVQQSSFEPVLPVVTNVPDNTSSNSVSENTSGVSLPEFTSSSDMLSDPPESSEPNSSGSGSGTSEPPETPLYQVTNHINEADRGAENVYVKPADTHQTAIPVDITVKLPEGVTLPEDRESFSCNTGDIGALRAYFLNDNVFYVRTQNDMRLYTIADGEAKLTASLACGEAKVFWIGENGGRLLALGSGNVMYEVSADDGDIREISLADAVGPGEIKEIAYNADSGILALNVYENGVYSLKIYEGGFETDKLKTLYTSVNNFVLVGADNGMVHFGAYSGDGLKIYRVTANEEASVVSSIQGEYDVTVNTAFTHAVLENDKLNLIYNPSSLNVILAQKGAAIDFGVSAHSFLSDGNYYTISNNEKLPSGGIDVISKIDFKNSFSKLYTAVPENGAVYIVEGSYTERAKNDSLTFETPVENASAEMRGALDAAVCLQNAIARGICGECGINDIEKLFQTMTMLFTENAAAELAKRCIAVEADRVEITDGGLMNINLSKTVFSVSDETDSAVSGTLYVSAGSFGGRSAYYAYPVKLVKTESGYLVDGIIG